MMLNIRMKNLLRLWWCVWLLGCGASSLPTTAPTQWLATTITPNATPTLFVVTTPAPLPTNLPRSLWQPDFAEFLPADAQLMRATPFVERGVLSWLVIYQERGSGYGLVIRREDDKGKAYSLGGAQPLELFRERWLGQTIDDINQDGQLEIMLEGVIKDKIEVVRVFQWNGATYVTLLALTGDAGVAIDDTRNNGVYDFTAMQLLFPRSVIFRATHAEWMTTTYTLQNVVLFLLGPPTTFTYPEEAALAYYAHWRRHEPERMARTLTEPQTSRMALPQLEELSKRVEEVRVHELNIADEQSESASVSVTLTLVPRGSSQAQTLRHTWRLQKEGNQWKLAELLREGN
jgi:hypothetical protein